MTNINNDQPALAEPTDDLSDFGEHSDAVVAAAHLAGRSGASEFEIGDNGITRAAWYASARFQGARISTDSHPTATGAAMAIAVRLLSGATCRCHRPIATSGPANPDKCRWQLLGQRWTPGCDAPPIKVQAGRGDLGAMQRAFSQGPDPKINQGRPALAEPSASDGGLAP